MLSKFLHFNYRPRPYQASIFPLSCQDLWLAFGLAGLVVLLGAWQMVAGFLGSITIMRFK